MLVGREQHAEDAIMFSLIALFDPLKAQLGRCRGRSLDVLRDGS